MREKIGAYLSVEKWDRQAGRKTDVWDVLTLRGDRLGIVQWHGPWRQYCFEAENRTVWSAGCFDDLSAFLKRVNVKHRKDSDPVFMGRSEDVIV